MRASEDMMSSSRHSTLPRSSEEGNFGAKLRELTLGLGQLTPKGLGCGVPVPTVVRFHRPLPEKWLKSQPESGRVCLICADIAALCPAQTAHNVRYTNPLEASFVVGQS